MSELRFVLPETARDRLPPSSRYEILLKIASGGMATVYVGRLRGAAGFSRVVAIKRAHAHLVEDAAYRKMLVAEARIASRIHHPNVVGVHDVEEEDGEVILAMDYVEGPTLDDLVGDRSVPLPPAVAVRILIDACAGLAAAHEALDDDGGPLGLVHRDVSPQNILVGADGIARIADFGIATSSAASAVTATGVLKGKVGYMAPEYVDGGRADVRADVFALGVVVWEALTGERLFKGATALETLKRVVSGAIEAPSARAGAELAAFDDVVLRALRREPSERFASVAELGTALEAAAARAGLVARAADVRAHVLASAGPMIEERRAVLRKRSVTPNAADVDSLEGYEPPVRTETFAGPRAQVAAADAPVSRGSGAPADVERTSGARARVVVAAVAAAIALGIGGVALRASSRGAEPRIPSASGEPSPSPSVPASSTVPAASLAPRPADAAPPAEPSIRAAPTRAPLLAGTTRPPAGSAAVSAPRVGSSAPTPSASAAPDRAPPNPYGR